MHFKFICNFLSLLLNSFLYQLITISDIQSVKTSLWPIRNATLTMAVDPIALVAILLAVFALIILFAFSIWFACSGIQKHIKKEKFAIE